MRFVVSCDLGTLGPGTGKPISYYWRWHYNVPGLALWAILALAILVPKANRRQEALLILVPVLLVNLLWLAAVLIFKPTASDREVFGIAVLSLTVTSAVLGLLGHGIARCTPHQGIVLALGLALGLALIGVLSIVDVSGQTIALASLPGILTPVVVLGYMFAGRMSRRAYGPRRFLVLLGIWTVAFSTVGMLLALLLGSAVSGHWPTHAIFMLGAAVMAGAIVGGCIFLVSLTFVLVGLRSPLFRARLFACLRLPSGSTPGDEVAVADAPERG